jgi:hypothetical protein
MANVRKDADDFLKFVLQFHIQWSPAVVGLPTLPHAREGGAQLRLVPGMLLRVMKSVLS